MDVTCERCDTEYEFDETLLSARGTTVKCTNCGHLFRVFPSGTRSQERTVWRLRCGDGSIETINSLRELQKRITLGELSQNDQIAKSGNDWKPLGEIAELESFFSKSASGAANEGHVAKQTLLGYSPLQDDENEEQTEVQSPASPAQPATTGHRKRNRTVLGTAPAPEEPAGEETETEDRRSSVPAPAPSHDALDAARSPFRDSDGDIATGGWDDDDDELPVLPTRKSGSYWAAFVLLGVACIVGWQWRNITDFLADQGVLAFQSQGTTAEREKPQANQAPAILSPLEDKSANATQDAPASSKTTTPKTADAPLAPPVPSQEIKKPTPPVKEKVAKAPSPTLDTPAPKEKVQTAPKPAPKASTPSVVKKKPKALASQRKPARDEDDSYDALRANAGRGSDDLIDGRPDNEADYEASMLKAQAFLATGQLDRARVYYENAIEARPTAGEPSAGLGQVAQQQGNLSLALRYFRVAARRGYREGYYLMGETYRRQGRTEQAMSAYHTYLVRSPNGPKAGAAKKELDALLAAERKAKAPKPQSAASAENTPTP